MIDILEVAPIHRLIGRNRQSDRGWRLDIELIRSMSLLRATMAILIYDM